MFVLFTILFLAHKKYHINDRNLNILKHNLDNDKIY